MLSRITEVTQNADGSISIVFLQNDGPIILQNSVTIEKEEVPRFLAAIGLKSIQMIKGMSICPNHLVDFTLETPITLRVKMKINAVSIGPQRKGTPSVPVPITGVAVINEYHILTIRRLYEYMVEKEDYDRIEKALGMTFREALSKREPILVTTSSLTTEAVTLYLPVNIEVSTSLRYAVKDSQQ